MPVEVSWYLEGYIVLVRYSGDVTLEDKRIGAEKEVEYLDAGQAPLIHVLLDMTDQRSAPNQIKEIQAALDKALSHPAKGWTLAYGNSDEKTETFVNTVVTQSYSVRYRTFATEQEAIKFLIYVDASLTELIDID